MLKQAASLATRLAIRALHGDGQVLRSLHEVGSVLCVELSRMGDIVAVLPVLESLKRELPQTELEVVVDREYLTLFQFVPCVDKVHGVVKGLPHLGLIRALTRLRRKTYGLVCSMSPSYRNGFVAAAARAKARIGYFESNDSLTPFLASAVVEAHGIETTQRKVYDRENLYRRSAKLCELLGIEVVTQLPRFHVSEVAIANHRESLLAHSLPIENRFVVFHPFGGWQYRWWSLEAAKIFLDGLIDDGIPIVIIGSVEEKAAGASLRSACKNASLVHGAFGLPIDQVVVLLKMASAFVGTDSGPLHLATAVDVPTVGLYGPAHPKFTAPNTDLNVYLYHEVECSPCDQRKCVRPSNPCMYLIKPSEVLQRVRELLRNVDGKKQ